MNALPLAGKTILVTRASHQAGKLSEKLRALGAHVVEIPAIEIVPPDSYNDLDHALRNMSQYQWLIVTSVNGARALATRMHELGILPGAFAHLKIAAVGSATERALQEIGLEVTITPPEYVAESLVESITQKVRGQRVVVVRAAVARDVIPGLLQDHGAKVDVIDAYQTIIPGESVTAMRTLFGPGSCIPDAATFTSSSTVTNFLNLLREAGVERPKNMRAVSIGPITTRTLRENDWAPAAEADPHNLDGLVEAVVTALKS